MAKFGEKVENFWYYHKWKTLIALFFTVVVVLVVIQMCQNKSHDAFVMYVGEKMESDTYEKVSASLESVCKDYDGNGEISVSLSEILFVSDASAIGAPTANNEAKNAFSVQLMGGGDYYLFFLSPDFYDLYEKTMFVPIADILGHGSDAQNDEYTVTLGKTPFYGKPGVSSLPADTLVCVKMVTYSMFDTTKRDEAQQHHFEILKRICGE
ncbi:MAG: hypothetical protein J5940_07410 [Clostridia bacterium]|nr:hypothetical protein [Clostridia bacterium]